MSRRKLFYLFPLLILINAGCSSLGIYTPLNRRPENTSSNLCVGIVNNMPPLAYRENKQFRGMEADFARKLARELNLQLVFVCEKEKNLFTSLENGSIDIAMAGLFTDMGNTYNIDYCTPYLIAGQLAVTRIEKFMEYRIPDILRFTRANIGVRPESKGEIVVRRSCLQATKVPISSKKKAAKKLIDEDIELYIDSPANIWDIAKKHESQGLVVMPWKLTNEPMAWAVRRGNDTFLADVNAALSSWREDGTVDSIIRRWVPGTSPRTEKTP